MIRVVLADDHAIMRQGLAGLITSEIEAQVDGQAEDGDQLLALIGQHRPDIAIVDVSMPGPGVSMICGTIRAESWPTRVIVLTMHQNGEMARSLLAAGASAYVVKKNAFEEVQAAIENVMQGNVYVSPLVAGQLIGADPDVPPLTQRELQIVRLIAAGLANKQIAVQLSISVKTVQTHRSRAMEKLGVHSAAELVSRSFETGLIAPG